MSLRVNFYVRPVAKRPVARDLGGSALVQPPADRLVAVEADMGAHIRAALCLRFPQPEFDGEQPGDLVAAVEACVAAGPSLPQWRSARVAEAREIAASLAALNARVVALVEGPKRVLVIGMNLAFMAAFVDAVEWPDVAIVERFVSGFPIVGDIPDSGLFRPVSRPATVPMSTFTPACNYSWTSELASSLTRRAAAASAEEREVLAELEAVTRKEAISGYVKGPFSSRRVDKLFGRGLWRPSRRFGVWQGEGDDRKMRAIDNAKGSQLNAAMSTHETIFCMTLFFVVMVASTFFSAALRARCRMPRLLIGLDDMRAAYRRIPVLTPGFTVFAIWSVVRGAVVYYFLPGHNFGLVSAVVNFNRFPHLMVAISRVLFAVPVDHFFDDYVIVDAHDGGVSGQEALAVAHELVGQEVEPKKRKCMAGSNLALGQHADVSRVHVDRTVTFSPVAKRCVTIMQGLREAKRRNLLSSGEAGRIRGKLGWVLSAAYARVGRAAAQPLTEREFSKGVDRSWTRALDEMLNFFEVLLALDERGEPRLPPLEVYIRRHSRRPVLVYSDAMFRRVQPGAGELWRDARGSPFSRVGFVVFVPGRDRPLVSRLVLPMWVYRYLSQESATLIQQAELIAAVGVYRTLPELLAGEAAIHFVDNTGALSNLIHGYASRPDCGRLVNAYHLMLADLRCKVWLEWVPSKANVSDLPSRDEDLLLMDAFEDAGFNNGFDEVDFDLPPMASWQAPLAAFAASRSDRPP